MRVMVIGKATEETENETQPGGSPQDRAERMEAMEKFNEELMKAGILLDGGGLKPSRLGKRVHFIGAKRTVTDGPFTETKELVAGYAIWQVRSMDEALEWVKRFPSPMSGQSDIEIRPLYEPEDFGPEVATQESERRLN